MEKILSTDLARQVQDDYLEYSLSVLIGRAIPSLTDGCKPIHRRILTAMKWLGLRPEGRYMKSARVEGEVMGKLSPHGSAYGSMVTLGAPWNNNLPLIDAQGNWGSSVDNAASSRYTEAKLSAFAWEALLDDSDIWKTMDNYDGSLQEPVELNVKIPLVLLNGHEGIGVGFATKIPSHNLAEICDSVINGTPLNPDFATGCDIVSDTGLAQYRLTGSGPIRCRAKASIGLIEKSGRAKERKTLTFTNLPPQTNPEKIGQQIKDALDKGQLTNITEVTDESDRTGDRLTVVTKPGADATLIQRQLYQYTDLDTKYSAKMLVIDNLKPCELSTAEVISRWKTWRLAVLEQKFIAERHSKESRLEIVSGLLKAIDKLDAVIKVIRASASPKEALIELVGNRNLKFTGNQARAILEMKLRSLTNLDSEELTAELTELAARLEALKVLIQSEAARSKYMLSEIKAISKKFGEPRRSSLIDIPESFASQSVSQRNTTPSIPKPRYIKVDTEKGTLTKAPGPRGALVLQSSDKLITLTADGTLKRLPSNYTGTLSSSYSRVLLAKPESDVTTRKYLLVFTYNGALKAMTIAGEHLTKVTSKGKAILPEGTTILHFSEKPYTVHFVSKRKKPITLDLTTKPGKPGGLGIKIGDLLDIQTTEPSFA
jgi:DNA gyrase subunit A